MPGSRTAVVSTPSPVCCTSFISHSGRSGSCSDHFSSRIHAITLCTFSSTFFRKRLARIPYSFIAAGSDAFSPSTLLSAISEQKDDTMYFYLCPPGMAVVVTALSLLYLIIIAGDVSFSLDSNMFRTSATYLLLFGDYAMFAPTHIKYGPARHTTFLLPHTSPVFSKDLKVSPLNSFIVAPSCRPGSIPDIVRVNKMKQPEQLSAIPTKFCQL